MPRRDECRKGLHRYTSSTMIGAGIRRDHCERCGAVRIDLSSEAEAVEQDLSLFAGATRRESFLGMATESDLPSPAVFGQARRRY